MLVRSEQIILTVCVSHALVLALFCLFSPGARVALARPGYVAYRNTLKALHLEPVELACGEAERFQVTADAVEQLEPAPDGLIVASSAIPTGTIIQPDALPSLAEACELRMTGRPYGRESVCQYV